jgi:hypothetical protein
MRPSTFRKRNLDVLWTIAFYGLALTIAVVVATHFRDEGMEWLPSLLFGAGAGAVGVWFLSWSFWQATMRFTRGAPFHIGDHVEITSGEHQGAVGEVQEVVEGRYAVRVMLENQTNTESSSIFNWGEIRRSPAK